MLAFPPPTPDEKKKGGELSRERKAAEEKVSEEQYMVIHVWTSSPAHSSHEVHNSDFKIIVPSWGVGA